MKLAWLSDLHFSADGDVLGHDTAARVDAAVAFINRYYADVDGCVISGDLANRGSAADYLLLRDLLAPLACPIYPMVGNHDDRAQLREHFVLPPSAMGDFVQYRVDCADAIILCLDTLCVGADGGEFCTAREHWLAEQLCGAAGRPVLVFMHHPPMALGLPMQDADNLADADAMLDLLAACEFAHLFIGHVHRPICGVVRGVPYATMRAVSFQAPAPRPEWSWENFQPAREAPGLGLISQIGGDVNLQYLQFCDYAVGT